MKLFNVLIFDQVVRGNVEVTSPPEYNELLGKADEIIYEFEVEEASGTTPQLSARHLHSNSGKRFIGLANLLTNVSLASGNLPVREVKTQSGPLGAQGQIGAVLSGADNVARLRIWACGRGK